MATDLDELSLHLQTLFEAENKVEKIITDSGLRFSTNKLTADLGEFYVFHHLTHIDGLFENLSASTISNSEFDLFGILQSRSIFKNVFSNHRLRIEVKTRRNQEGVKYLTSVKPEKFDLLCVVDLAKNYSLNNIYFVTSKVAAEFLDKKYQRLIFKTEMAFEDLNSIINNNIQTN